MDSLQLLVSWSSKSSKETSRSRTSVDITATLSGIYIQGARMTSAVGMEECFIETPSWNSIPPCFLSWVPIDDTVRNIYNYLLSFSTLRLTFTIYCFYRILLESMDFTL